MSAVITSQPIAPDAPNFGSTDNNQFGDTFILDSGGLYNILAYYYDPIHLGTEILKSIDGGLTWVSVATVTGVGSFYISSFYDAATRTIYFTNAGSGGVFNIQRYSCATDSLGSATADTGAISGVGGRVAISHAAGNLFLFYSKTAASTTVNYQMYSSGSWGPETLISNEGTTNVGILSTCVDSSNVSHLLYSAVDFVSGDMKHALIDSAGTVGVVSTIETVAGAPAFATPNDGKLLISGANIFAAYATVVSAPHVAIGTPVNAPVWSSSIPDPTYNPATDTDNYVDLAIDGNGKVNLFWIVTVQTGPVFTSQKIYLNSYSGTAWGSSVLFYDYLSNPPDASLNPGGPSSYAMQRVRAQWVNSGWTGTTNLFLVGALGTVPTGFVFPSTPLAPTCSITVTGVPKPCPGLANPLPS